MTELAVGTMKLEGTADAVTREQARQLIPLWEVYSEIATSDTAAAQEIEGLTSQLQQAMTEGQLQSISAMNLTQEDVFSMMREFGPAVDAGGESGSGSAPGNGGFPGGGVPGGGPPGGFVGGEFQRPDGAIDPGGGFAGGAPGTETRPAGAQQSRRPGLTGIPPALLNAVVEYLKNKAASE